MDYKGVIIEESLEDKSILTDVKILRTVVEKVTPMHATPWIKNWTLHTVEVSERSAGLVAEKLSICLDSKHEWYADFKNDKWHFVIFRNRVFKVNRSMPAQYKTVTDYGISIGIPRYQLDFSPAIEEWKRK